MPSQRRWLPREGFTADTIQTVIQNTLLNPFVTVPLWLLARYNDRARGLSLDHPTALNRLKICMYLGIARWVNNFLSQGALNNWKRAKFDWSKELVLITGGSDGFGKLWTLMFAKKNVKVVVLDIQKPTYELPPNVHFYTCDLSSPEQITSVSQTIKSELGNPTVLINNAGIANHHTIFDTPDSRLTRLVAVNQLAHYRIIREFLPHIASTNHGIVVTVASLAGYVVPAGLVDYCGSKAAAVAFHEGIAAELAHRYNAPSVRTILLAPNFAATKLAEGFQNSSKFISPTLHPETVAEAVFAQIMSGNSGYVILPKVHWWMASTVRAWPLWLQKGLGRSLAEVMRPYNKLPHREDVDPEVMKLFVEGKVRAEDLSEEEFERWKKGELGKGEVRKLVEERKRR